MATEVGVNRPDYCDEGRDETCSSSPDTPVLVTVIILYHWAEPRPAAVLGGGS